MAKEIFTLELYAEYGRENYESMKQAYNSSGWGMMK
jgi:hypothetical protein